MNPWLETLGVIGIVFIGLFAARVSSRLTMVFIPFSLIFLIAIARFWTAISYSFPITYVTNTRARFVALAFAITMSMSCLIPRLKDPFAKVILSIVTAILVLCFSVCPFFASALIHKDLGKLNGSFNSQGICFQSRDYTCGPAAAATALKALGFNVSEGRLAVLSHSNPVTGTLLSPLRTAIYKCFGDQGIECELRAFDSVEQMKNSGIVLTQIRSGFLTDHCVAVLEITDDMITVADPAMGTRRMSIVRFAKIWRFAGITLTRKTLSST